MIIRIFLCLNSLRYNSDKVFIAANYHSRFQHALVYRNQFVLGFSRSNIDTFLSSTLTRRQ